MSRIITRDALAVALERCCTANPSTGPGHQLHPDAALMADLFGFMLHHKQTESAAAGVRPDILAAFQRWAVATEPPAGVENIQPIAT